MLDEIGAGGVPELLVVNKADRAPRAAARLANAPRGCRGGLGPHRRGHRRRCCGPWATGCASPTGWWSSSSPSTAATCWPPCTARARWSTRPTAKGPPWSTSSSTTPGGPGSASSWPRDGVPGEPGGGFVAAARTPTTAWRRRRDRRRRPPRRGGRPVGRARRATRRPRRWSRALGVVGDRARLPGVGRQRRRCAGAARTGCERRFGVSLDAAQVAACVGTKEFVATRGLVPAPAHPRSRHRPVPGARLPDLRHGGASGRLPGGGGARRPRTADWTSTPVADADAERALCLWVNSPANPTGALDRPGCRRRLGTGPRRARALRRVLRRVHLGRRPPPTVVAARHRRRAGRALAVEALQPGRACASGSTPATPTLVDYLSEVRKHAGLMVPGPGAGGRGGGLDDDAHVDAQRERYRRRLARLAEILRGGRPGGGVAGGRLLPVGAGARRGPTATGRGDEGRPGAWVLDHGPGRGGRDAREPGRVLRRRRRGLRAHRGGPTRRAHRAGGRAPGVVGHPHLGTA